MIYFSVTFYGIQDDFVYMLLFLVLRYRREVQTDHSNIPRHHQTMTKNYDLMAEFTGKNIQ